MLRRNLLRAFAVLAGSSGINAASPVNRIDRARDDRSGRRAHANNFVEVADGTNLFFRDSGVGKPMLFAAPWALNSAWWEYQVNELAGMGIRCITYDRRGHGRSGEPNRGYDFDTLADDLAAIIEQLELSDVTLVGHSMGCGEVVRFDAARFRVGFRDSFWFPRSLRLH